MSLKDGLDRGLDAIKKGADNVKDGIDEASHRGNAAAERESREVAGDQMTIGENVGSVLNEGKESVLADVDKAKRDLRNTT